MLDKQGVVNRGAYMDFKEATDNLFDRVDHESLARELGVSVASIRQARLRADAQAYRAAPPRWREAVIKIAEEKAAQYKKLASTLSAGRPV
jgi:hypothetical protein